MLSSKNLQMSGVGLWNLYMNLVNFIRFLPLMISKLGNIRYHIA